jgi:hypothetical protein
MVTLIMLKIMVVKVFFSFLLVMYSKLLLLTFRVVGLVICFLGRAYPQVDLEWWRRLGDPMFKSHFRMDRTLFEVSKCLRSRVICLLCENRPFILSCCDRFYL